MSKFKTECAFCGNEFDMDDKDFAKNEKPEPICGGCQALIAEGREDEIE